jgi:2-polyprenyl-3-methyl-5-hydroxy-6-metoxy-1,4-benzoquinol methylase
MEENLVTSHESDWTVDPRFSKYGALRRMENSISVQAPFLKKVFQSRIQDFGLPWAERFDTELNAFFSTDSERVRLAAKGYADFALDAIRLQKKFNKTREYIHKTYADLMDSVYLNHEYMFNLYLPGILLSQYLWPHHYRQLEFFWNRFVPLARQNNVNLFYDIGVGTGFYSKEALRALPNAQGCAIDISPHSLSHAQKLVDAWGLNLRYEIKLKNIIEEPMHHQADALINVEVLEHLEDPKQFLRSLYSILKNGGIAFVTAAVNAPNFDHIYLYRSLNEVAAQISAAGFKIIDSAEYIAYAPASQEIAPSSAVFILRKVEM